MPTLYSIGTRYVSQISEASLKKGDGVACFKSSAFLSLGSKGYLEKSAETNKVVRGHSPLQIASILTFCKGGLATFVESLYFERI